MRERNRVKILNYTDTIDDLENGLTYGKGQAKINGSKVDFKGYFEEGYFTVTKWNYISIDKSISANLYDEIAEEIADEVDDYSKHNQVR